MKFSDKPSALAGTSKQGKASSREKPEKQKAKPKASASSADSLIDAKLRTSALSHEDRKVLRIAEAKPEELRALRLPCSVPAMEIPYFELDGKEMGWKRWRYLADSRTPLERLAHKKERRYVQAPNTLPRFYFPPLKDWARIAEDPRIKIVITEGELKAACCTKLVAPCIGLGGVFSFRSKKFGVQAVREFKMIDWQDREVVVVFDSDAENNPMVIAGRNQLCQQLNAEGAKVLVADTPAGDDGEKQGIDDLVAAKGPKALANLIEAAMPWGMSSALRELNEKVCYIRTPGIIVRMEDNFTMNPNAFVNHAFSNIKLPVLNASGNVVLKSAADEWLKWERRFELNRISYDPGCERIHEKSYNIWPGWGCEPVEGDITPWTKLLDHIFNGFPKERDWFERWCAYPIQHPGSKMFSAAVIWGSLHGTGKSLIGASLGRIYGKNYSLISDKELADARLEWAENKQFVMGDDVMGHEQRKFADRLKTMITQETMRIDRKYVASYEIIDRINYYFTSNHADAFFLEDDDRRFFIHEARVGKMPQEFYRAYRAWMLQSDAGPSALFHHLLNLDLKGMDCADPAMQTLARSAMVSDSLSDLGTWVRQLKAAPEAMLTLQGKAVPGDLWTSVDLLPLYDPDRKTRVTANGLTREMKAARFQQVYGGQQVKLSSGLQVRLWALKNQDIWMSPRMTMKDLVMHYEETRLGIRPKEAEKQRAATKEREAGKKPKRIQPKAKKF